MFYDTLIMVATYFKQQIFVITSLIFDEKMNNKDEEVVKEFFDRLKALLSEKTSLSSILTQLVLGVSSFVPSVTWLDEIAEALRSCITGCNSFIDMCNNYRPEH